jgi:hypothetical protein
MSADYKAKHEKPVEKPSMTEFKAAIADFCSQAFHACAETKPETDN